MSLPVAAYLRLSTREQAKDPNALESHLFRVKKAIAEIGGEFDERFIFIDIMSGRRSDRPNFQALIKLIETKAISAVVVRLDRLSRDGEMFQTLSKLFERTGVRLFDLNKGRFIDFSNPEEWGEYQFAGINAEKESRTISRRGRDRKEFTRHLGKIQNGSVPFGYRRSVEGTYEPNPEEWAIARFAIETFLDCFNQSVTVRLLKDRDCTFSPQGFVYWLKSEVIRGNTPYLFTNHGKAGERVPTQIKYSTHQPLISEAEAQQIDLVLNKKKTRRDPRPDLLIPLSGLVWCDRCDSHCVFMGHTRKKVNYRTAYCAGHRKNSGCGGFIEGHGKTAGKMGKLGTPYTLIEAAVIKALCDRAIQIAQSPKIGSPNEPALESPEVTLLKQAIYKYELLAADDPDLLPVLAKKQNDLTLLLSTNAPSHTLEYSREKLASFAGDVDFWECATLPERLILYGEFVDRVFCAGKSVRVVLRV